MGKGARVEWRCGAWGRANAIYTGKIEIRCSPPQLGHRQVELILIDLVIPPGNNARRGLCVSLGRETRDRHSLPE